MRTYDEITRYVVSSDTAKDIGEAFFGALTHHAAAKVVGEGRGLTTNPYEDQDHYVVTVKKVAAEKPRWWERVRLLGSWEPSQATGVNVNRYSVRVWGTSRDRDEKATDLIRLYDTDPNQVRAVLKAASRAGEQ